MTTTDIPYPSYDNKVSTKNASVSYKISLDPEAIIHVALGQPARGAQHLGRKHRVKEFYVDPGNRIFAGYIAKDSTGQFYQYAEIGRLYVLEVT
jgi:hypothetical protein